MTVEELIEELKQMPRTAIVIIDTEHGDFVPTKVYYKKGEATIQTNTPPRYQV